MIKIENTEVMGWEHAIRGMRNPMNSWDKSDSGCLPCEEYGYCSQDGFAECGNFLGANDLNLMRKLVAAGSDHRKFMRMITVYTDITAPLYWWKEFDTYKVGTVANSCSTMHKIHAKEFTLDDFSYDHLSVDSTKMLKHMIDFLNVERRCYQNSKDKTAWWQMIQLLPCSYNQKRTVMLNYEVLHNMYHARKAHKLDEWKIFCQFVETLPYSELITGKVEAING